MREHRSIGFFCISCLLITFSLVTCVPPQKLVYTPHMLKKELRRRLPKEQHNEIIVPFEVDIKDVRKAQKVVKNFMDVSTKVQALKTALFNPHGFGIVYAEQPTFSAKETIRNKQGNCLSLASLFVGLGRHVGLKAFFMDASNRIEDVHKQGEVIVRTGHITAVVETGHGMAALDFGRRLGHYRTFRPISDLEATAHFYNNRAYEQIIQDNASREDWKKALNGFQTAVAIMPSFARAWNNMGVAYARLGNVDEATHSYKTAIEAEKTFASPYYNWALIELSRNHYQKAKDILITSQQHTSDYEPAKILLKKVIQQENESKKDILQAN